MNPTNGAHAGGQDYLNPGAGASGELMPAADGIPAVAAFLSRDGKTVRFYCEHCRADHVHGADGIANGENPHRVAHCTTPASPYKRAGYVLRIAGVRA